jgi:hypothetical protein
MQTTISSAVFHNMHLNYIRNSRAISVLWCVFTVCFVIINIVVFSQPWLGSTSETEKEGYFSLYESCVYDSENSTMQIVLSDLGEPIPQLSYRFFCEGNWKIIATSVNPTATFFIGISALLNLICIATFLVLFLFINPSIVFTICGIIQLFSSKFYYILLSHLIFI